VTPRLPGRRRRGRATHRLRRAPRSTRGDAPAVSAAVEEVVAGARLVLVLEDIVDHTNVGAAFRAAAGLGADAVLVTQRCADPLYRRSVRVSMGTVFQVPWTRLPDEADGGWSAGRDLLHDAGLHLAALALADDAVALDAFAAARPPQVALLMGAEGDGLSRRALAAADTVVTIPMTGGVDSLNVARRGGGALGPALSLPTGACGAVAGRSLDGDRQRLGRFAVMLSPED
jgi:tRNA G18 (ribose-2'-O)-methylase SpoU